MGNRNTLLVCRGNDDRSLETGNNLRAAAI